MRAAKFKELLLVLLAITIVLATRRLLRWRRFLFILRRTQHDFGIDRKRLEHDIVALAVFVGEGRADVEPVVVLAFALDNRVRLEGWLISHGQLLSVGEWVSTHRRA